MYFNPRSPDGERPNQLLTNPSSQGISIHAPRMGSDAGLALGGDTWPHISIHAPRMGSDHPDVDYLIVANQFQSTLPGWGATSVQAQRHTKVSDFNPRSPDGERRPSSAARRR